MAKNKMLDQLAKKPLRIQLAILGAVVVVLGFGYWQFFYGDLQEQRAAAEGRKRSIAKKLDELRADAKEQEQLRREQPERKQKIKQGLLKLPARSELPAFLRQLQNQAGSAGVKLKNYSQQSEILVDDFIKVPYKLEATGTFYQLARYFWLLWEYSESPSGLIITIENLSLGEAVGTADGIVLTANFTASTFRQAEANDPALLEVPSAAPAAVPGGKAGAAAAGKVDAAKKKTESSADKAADVEGAP